MAERSGSAGGDRSAAAGPPAGESATGSTAPTPTVVERTVYRDGPGDSVELAIVYEIPEAVSRLAFWIERPDVAIVATDGFEASGVDRYTWQGSVDGPAFEWDGEGDRATVVLRQPLEDAPATYGAGTATWALCLRPRTHTRWRYRGPEPMIDREAVVRGDGVAGEQFAFLGDHAILEETVEPGAEPGDAGARPGDADARSRDAGAAPGAASADAEPAAAGADTEPAAAGADTEPAAAGADAETVRLVVPAAADLAAEPRRVVDALTAASDRLDVGGRNPLVTVFVAPTTGVSWAHRGLSLGPDARVNDVAPLDAPTSIWVHEYVHTRQDRAATTAETQWLLEACAEYYAATQAFERGTVDYETYRHVLERGIEDRPGDVVLADPATWVEDAQYRKGALVVAALDRRIRAATGGEATFQAVLRAWNDADPGAFDAAAFADAVEAAGGPAARAAAVAYTQTPTTPTCWSPAAHAAVFDLAPGECGAERAPRADATAESTVGSLLAGPSDPAPERSDPGVERSDPVAEPDA